MSIRVPRWLVVVLVVVLVIGLAAVWRQWQIQQVRDGVSVAWTGPAECTGAEVRATERRSLLLTRDGMRCVVEVIVTNDADGPVEVSRVLAWGMGPGGGGVVRADPDQEPAYLPGRDNNIVAFRDVGEELDPGGATTLSLVLVFRPRGCNASGSTTTLGGFPTVEVRAWGRTLALHPPNALAWRHEGITPPGCLA